MEKKTSNETFSYDDLSILLIHSESKSIEKAKHTRSKSSAEIHRYVEFKKSIKSTGVFLGNPSNNELEGGYAWHNPEDNVQIVEHGGYYPSKCSLTKLNDEIVQYATETIQNGIDKFNALSLCEVEPINILEQIVNQSREDVDMVLKYHAANIRQEIEKQLEEGIIENPAEHCIADLSDVDFNDVPYLNNKRATPSDKIINNSDTDGESSSSIASVEETFSKLKDKFNSTEEDTNGFCSEKNNNIDNDNHNDDTDDDQLEDVLNRIIDRCYYKKDDEKRGIRPVDNYEDDEEYSSEATLNTNDSSYNLRFPLTK